MKGPLVVHISGSHKSGKTTFLNRLADFARSEGFNVIGPFDDVVDGSQDAQTPIKMDVGDIMLCAHVPGPQSVQKGETYGEVQ